MSSSAVPLPRGCDYCGGTNHVFTACPRIKVIEYHQDGSVKRVELHSSADRLMALETVLRDVRSFSRDAISRINYGLREDD